MDRTNWIRYILTATDRASRQVLASDAAIRKSVKDTQNAATSSASRQSAAFSRVAGDSETSSRRVVRSLDGQAKASRAAREELRKFGFEQTKAWRAGSAFDNHLRNTNLHLTRLRQSIRNLAVPALVAAFTTLAQAAATGAGGVVALVGALEPLGGLAATLPAGIIGLAQAFGTLFGAISPVKQAVTDYMAMWKSAGTQEQTASKGIFSAAKAIQSAQQAVHDATLQTAEANRTLEQSQTDVERAQTELNKAISEGKREMVDLKNAAIDAALSQQQAGLSLRQAIADMRKAELDPHSTMIEVEQAQLAVRQARQGAKEATIAAQRASSESEHAKSGGVDKLPNVIAATRALADAKRSEADAARGMTKAETGVTRALEQVANAHKQAGMAASHQASQAVNLAYDLAKLSPAAKQFALFMAKFIQGPLGNLERASQTAFLPKLEKGILHTAGVFPVLERAMKRTGSVLGGLSIEAGKLIGSKGFGRQLEKVTQSNSIVMRTLGQAALSVAKGMMIVAVAARPLTEWLGRLVKGWADAWATTRKTRRETGAMGQKFEETKEIVRRLVSIASNLYTALNNILHLSKPLGDSMFAAFDRSSRKFKEWTDSAKGKSTIEKFFERIKPALFEAGRLLSALVKGLAEMGMTSGLAPLLKQMRIELLPAILEVAEGFSSAFGPGLVELLTSVLQMFNALGHPLTTMLTVTAHIVDAFSAMVQHVPGLKQLLSVVIAISLASRAISFVAAISGISALVGKLRDARVASMAATTAEGGLGSRRGITAGVNAAKASFSEPGLLPEKPLYVFVVNEMLGSLTSSVARAGVNPNQLSLFGPTAKTVGSETASGASRFLPRGAGTIAAGSIGGIAAGVGGQMVGGTVGNAISGAGAGIAAGSLFGPWGMAIGGVAGAAATLIPKLGDLFSSEKKLNPVQQKLINSSREWREAMSKLRLASSGLGQADQRLHDAHERLRNITKHLREAQERRNAVVQAYGPDSRQAIHAEAVLTEWTNKHRHAKERLENVERIRGVALSAYKTETNAAVLVERRRISALQNTYQRQQEIFLQERRSHPSSDRTRRLAERMLDTERKLNEAVKKHASTIRDAATKAGPKYAEFLETAKTAALRAGRSMQFLREETEKWQRVTGRAMEHKGESFAGVGGEGNFFNNRGQPVNAGGDVVRRNTPNTKPGGKGDDDAHRKTRKNWQDTADSVKKSADEISKKTQDSYSNQAKSASSGSGKVKKTTSDNYSATRKSAGASLDSLHTKNEVIFKGLVTTASTQGGRYRNAIRETYSSAENTVFHGLSYFEQETNKGLKAFNIKPVKLGLAAPKGSKGSKGGGGGGGDGKVAGVNVGWARGGMMTVPGFGLQDTVPLTGTSIAAMVAPGENLMVTNRHQQPLLDMAVEQTFGVGGMDGFFGAFDTPHFAATGTANLVAATKGYAGGGILRTPNVTLPPASSPIHGLETKLSKMGFEITSGTDGTHAPNSYHYKGEALDYGDSVNDLVKLANVVWPIRKSAAELLMPLRVPHGGLYNYGVPFSDPGLQSEHEDHIHVAIAGAIKGALGKSIGGGAGGMGTPRAVSRAIKEMKDLQVTGPEGPLTGMINQSFKKVRAGAIKKLTGSGGLAGPGGFKVSGRGVEAQIARGVSKAGGNKIAAAGIIGNAYRESGLVPTAVGTGGGGLWGFTSGEISLASLQAAAGRAGVPWGSTEFQTNFMLQHGGKSLLPTLNKAPTPGDSARIFMEQWERPGIPALSDREWAARRAYSRGYNRGGMVPRGGASARRRSPAHRETKVARGGKIPRLKSGGKIKPYEMATRKSIMRELAKTSRGFGSINYDPSSLYNWTNTWNSQRGPVREFNGVPTRRWLERKLPLPWSVSKQDVIASHSGAGLLAARGGAIKRSSMRPRRSFAIGGIVPTGGITSSGTSSMLLSASEGATKSVGELATAVAVLGLSAAQAVTHTQLAISTKPFVPHLELAHPPQSAPFNRSNTAAARSTNKKWGTSADPFPFTQFGFEPTQLFDWEKFSKDGHWKAAEKSLKAALQALGKVPTDKFKKWIPILEAMNLAGLGQVLEKLKATIEGQAEAVKKLVDVSKEKVKELVDKATAKKSKGGEKITTAERKAIEKVREEAAPGLEAARGKLKQSRQKSKVAAAIRKPLVRFHNAIQNLSVGQLNAQQGQIEQQISQVKKGGVSKKERGKLKRLQAMLEDVTNTITEHIKAVLLAAEHAVEQAAFAHNMADMGLQHLELEQQLAGTGDTLKSKEARATYIRGQIIPTLQSEQGALESQLAAARELGGEEGEKLAMQIAEQIAAVQNGILQAQLEAQELTAAAVQDLNDAISGSLGFEFNSQGFTDLMGLGVGA